LRRGKAYRHFHIPEGFDAHPCNSSNGLLSLAQVFRDMNCVFIRIHRNPVQIYKSFCRLRAIYEETRDPDIERMAGYSDETILNMIKSEKINFDIQRSTSTHNYMWSFPFKYCLVNYNGLDNIDYVQRLTSHIVDFIGVEPKRNYNLIRDGFLQYRQKDSIVRIGSMDYPELEPVRVSESIIQNLNEWCNNRHEY
jgi:hypothetical protein